MSDSLSKGFYNGKPNPFEVGTYVRTHAPVFLYRTVRVIVILYRGEISAPSVFIYREEFGLCQKHHFCLKFVYMEEIGKCILLLLCFLLFPFLLSYSVRFPFILFSIHVTLNLLTSLRTEIFE